MSKHMCEVFKKNGIKLTTDGTDSHIILIHTGDNQVMMLQILEEKYNIVVNKNSIPNDPKGVWETSGIRIGTAAMVTVRGNDKVYFEDIANKIISVLK